MGAAGGLVGFEAWRARGAGGRSVAGSPLASRLGDGMSSAGMRVAR